MHDFLKRFRSTPAAAPAATPAAERISRNSSGLQELMRSLRDREGLRILDLGPTSPANITQFTGMGYGINNEDVLLASRDPSLLIPGENGETVLDVPRFMAENLRFEREAFDAALFWDVFDYLHADLVKPVVHLLHTSLKPKGLLLGFFHTKDAGPDAPYHRYHIAGVDKLELQRIPAPLNRQEGAGRNPWFRLQRVFNNRHIENLFRDYASIKFFLGRDNIREVLVVR